MGAGIEASWCSKLCCQQVAMTSVQFNAGKLKGKQHNIHAQWKKSKSVSLCHLVTQHAQT